MKSIRNRITAWLLVGLTLLWIAGGSAIYLASRSASLAAIDAENQGFARQVRSLSRGDGGPARWLRDEESISTPLVADGLFYQVWTLDGEVLLRSKNLGARNLPQLDVTGETSVFKTIEFVPGTRIRLAATQFAGGRAGGRREGRGPPAGVGGGGMPEPVLVVVGRDLAKADNQSQRLLLGLGVIGLVAAAGTALLLGFALRDGLRPLHQLGEAVSAVDASSLDARFGDQQVPRELRPVVTHLDALMDRLETSFQRERRFSADLAHELKTPIAELQIMAELSIEWPAERTDQQMRDIRGVTRRMQGVVETLLHLSRLENGSEQFTREPVEIRDLIEDAWTPHAETAEKRGLRIDIQCPRDATMPGNRELWRHVLGNLLANAAEYASPGGRIHVLSDNDTFGIANPVENLYPDEMEKMFERFWRADDSRTGTRHSGLGLSLVKACVTAMGLQIFATLEDPPDGETLLVVTIREPASEPASP